MNAQELIQAYIDDVCRRLPRRLRKDVGLELSSLLQEDLQARAADSGRDADVSLAQEIVDGFGHPREVAARYRPPVMIIDPVDSHRFIYSAVAGVLFIWIAGFAELAGNRSGESVEFLYQLRDWWLGAGLAAFWWPGILVAVFAIGARVKIHWPQSGKWRPAAVKVKDRDKVNRWAWGLALVFFSLGLYILSEPGRILDWMFGGEAAPSAYEALSYAPDFYPMPAIPLFALLIANLLLYIPLIVSGRWTSLLRRLDIVFSFLICTMLVWIMAAGQIFAVASVDDFVKFIILLIVVGSVIDKGLELEREINRTRTVTPAT